MRVGLVGLVVLFAGCVQSSSVVCGDRVCPEHTACTELVGLMDGSDPHRCVPPSALTACSGMTALASCTYPDLQAGVCYTTTDGAVCLAPGCGNGLQDTGEVCDDGNNNVGDGCSQQCRSDETCGNGIVDPSRLEMGSLVPNESCDDGNKIGHDACNICQPEVAGWTNITVRAIGARTAAPLTFDPFRRRFIMSGGTFVFGAGSTALINTPIADTCESDGVAWVQFHAEPAPSARRGAAIAFDGTRRRAVMFGGNDGVVRSDTWEWDGTRWTLDAPAAIPPARMNAALAYDSKRKVIVLFGGIVDASQLLTDTWEWNGTTWTQIATATAPTGHLQTAMAFDPVRAVTVMVGTDTDSRETWEYDGAAWSRKDNTTTPDVTSIAYDAVGHRMIAYGEGTTTATTYAWNGSSWSALAGQSQPGNLGGASLASDPISGHVLMFGGATTVCSSFGCSTQSHNQTWIWNGSTWTEQKLATPEARFAASAVLDTRHGVVMVLGGGDNGTSAIAYDDCWRFNGTSWVKDANQPWPEGRTSVAAAYDSDRDEVITYGGFDTTNSKHEDTWVRKNGVWTQKATTSPLGNLISSQMAYDPVRHKTILFSGAGNIGSEMRTMAWDGTSWTELSPAHSPPDRYNGSLAWDPIRRELVLFGGIGGSTSNELADTWTWDGTDWTERTTNIGPPGRQYGGLAWDAARQAMMLTAGTTSKGVQFDDTWQWNGTTWKVVAAPPTPVHEQTAIVSAPGGAGILTVGGVGTSGAVDDLWRLRWDGEQNYEQCRLTTDDDRDGAKGCEDPDCWATCSPLCPPGSTCDPSAPHCGDHTCDPVEDCRSCPGDCACTAVCGDLFCDSGETQASCPGDCTP